MVNIKNKIDTKSHQYNVSASKNNDINTEKIKDNNANLILFMVIKVLSKFL